MLPEDKNKPYCICDMYTNEKDPKCKIHGDGGAQVERRVSCPPLDKHVRFILGRPCFTLGGIAERLRELGHEIKRKAEDEQAVVIHWMLSMYAKHGEDWLKKGNAELKEGS